MATRFRHLQIMAVALGLSLFAGCASTSPVAEAKPDVPSPAVRADFSEPRAFVEHLVKIAEANDLEAWTAQLSPARRARGEGYARKHLEAWRKALMDAAPVIRTATSFEARESSSTRSTIAFTDAQGNVHRLIRVSRIQGALKIDEN